MRNVLQVSRYVLEIELNIDSGEVYESCELIFSRTSRRVSNISLLLNKGLHVLSIKNKQGKDLSFTQDLKSFFDLKALQANRILVSFNESNLDKDCIISIYFRGRPNGYEDVFPYTKDPINRHFSLLRPDIFAYPVLGDLNFKQLIKKIVNQSFTYDLKVSVPRGYIVACGGKLLSKAQSNGKKIYNYTSYAPTWRIDVAVAKFKVVTNHLFGLKMYVFPEDLSAARQVQEEIKRTLLFYENWFGPPPKTEGFTLIEIPRGWGSQAGTNYVLLEEDSFKSKDKHGLYHELAHLWNVKSAEKFPSRFFDEGFASYFQALAEKKFLGNDAFERRMKAFQQSFGELCKKDSRFLKTPLCDYGKFGLTDASYFKGAWALYVLHKLLGVKFRNTIKSFLQAYRKKPATLEEFKKYIESMVGQDFQKFFNEWFFDIQSSFYLVKGVNIDEIVEKYRKRLNQYMSFC